MKLSEFDYNLPKESIAQCPVSKRDSSMLMVLHRRHRTIEHRIFRNISEYFQQGDVLILNDTRVIPARIYGKKTTGGKIEILLIKEFQPNKWEVIVKGLQNGTVAFNNGISGHISRNNGTVTLTSDYDIKEMLNTIGVMPLPPYIKRPVNQLDARQYQTVYAEKDGAIAAPTAGLHFTKELLEKIKEKGVVIRKLTLHVGYGTFKPVSCEEIEDHHMDEEYYEIPEQTAHAINCAKSEGRRIIAVGTTATRALEASVLGENEKWKKEANLPIPPLLKVMTRRGGERGVTVEKSVYSVKASAGKTSIFIYPGYKFKVVDALVTNFHLPKSTPLMLTSAFSGIEFLKEAYSEALDEGYRFFSYGDAMLIM